MRKKIIVIFIILIILIGAVIVLTYSKTSSHHPTNPTTPYIEKGSEGNQSNINIENTSALYSHLLATQFVAVKQAVDQYINTQISPSVLQATIVSGSTVLNYNSSINFTVQIAKPKTTFSVLLQIPNANEIIFSVVGTNYKITLNPYGNTGNTE